MVQTRSTSHQKAVEHRAFGEWHQQLKLIARRSYRAGGQHDLGNLLVEIVFSMCDLHPKLVAVKRDRLVQIRHCDADMIKTK